MKSLLRRRLGRWVLGLVTVAGGVALAARFGVARERRAVTAIRTEMPRRLVPEDTRIRVEVLNASGTRGVARQATFALRDAGFDVVYFGNAPESRDSTLVIDRLSHPAWAKLAARAMRSNATAVQTDSARYVDLTILVGRDWSSASQPFHP